MTEIQSPRLFAKRATRHTLILASGERVRHVTLRSWTLALAGTLSLCMVLGSIGSAGYLVLRDDFIAVGLERQAKLQRSYEDRIAALRAQVDRLTSRQILDQKRIEREVERIIAHQADLTTRNGKLDALLERAGSQLSQTYEPPVPTPRPNPDPIKRARTDTALDAIAMISRTERQPASEAEEPDLPSTASAYAAGSETRMQRADRLFGEIRSSLDAIERRQMHRARALADDAERTAETIDQALRHAGAAPAEDGIGGPFLPDTEEGSSGSFDSALHELDQALGRLDRLRDRAAAMPLGHPAKGKAVTSHFGTRRDPFLRRSAFHAGIDFRLGRGETVRASGGGKVVRARRTGGYGNMVEIEHGDGLTSRYAHLSRIDVSEGQIVLRGEPVGTAGSTGRSTGPHLHYEVRRNGKPVDPATFLQAGRKVEPLLASAIMEPQAGE